MDEKIQSHYTAGGDLSRVIAETLRKAGKNPDQITAIDLASVDEFHIRGRKALFELAGFLNTDASSDVLDIGSGLGGPARTLAETFGCRRDCTGSGVQQRRCLKVIGTGASP